MQEIRSSAGRTRGVLCPSCQAEIADDGGCACAAGSFPRVGSTLAGTWKLNAVLGAGGMGRVYDAMDLSLKRRVAVKVLDRNAPSMLRERFIREAEVLGKLDHAAIVPVHAAGTTSSGEPFIVMKWLDGVDLRTWAAKGNVGLRELLPLLREVAAGLDALHVRGIVHRDIKPENIMVLHSGHAMIIDLGVARTTDSQLTAVGFTVGTVEYLSPEQLHGEAVTPATDTYALALVAYELLSNRGSLSRAEVSRQLVERLGGRLPTLRSVNGNVSLAVSAVFEKALALAPGARFESGASFIAALEEAEHPPSAHERAITNGETRRAEGRSTPVRWPLIAGGVLAVWGLGVLGYALWPAAPVEPPRPVKLPPLKANLAFTNPETNAPVAESLAPLRPAETTARTTEQREVASAETAFGDESDTSGVPAARGVLAKFVDHTSVIDDVTIGEFRREIRDGQSIDGMLERMTAGVKAEATKEELYGRTLERVTDLCAAADTKKKLIDCDDETRRLHSLFFRSEF